MSTNGVISAPMTREEVIEAVRAHKVNWFDLALLTGGAPAGQWTVLLEVTEFRQSCNELGPYHLSAFYGWVVGRNPERGVVRSPALSDAPWIGPLDHPTLARKIAAGEISYSDVVWRPGITGWQRIGSCVDFSEAKDETTVPTNLTALASYLLINESGLEKTQRLAHTEMVSATHEVNPQVPNGERPAEACGIDLVGELPWMRSLLTIMVVACLGLPVSNARAGTVTTLDVVGLKLGTDKPSFVIQTDAPSGEAIDFSLIGASGDILGHLSWQKTVHVVRQAGEIPSVELAPGEVPQGWLTVSAMAGELKVSKKVFIGKDDREFRLQLKNYVKSTAAQRQTEKMTLFHEAQALKRLAHDLGRWLKEMEASGPSAWHDLYASWQAKAEKSEKSLRELTPDEGGELAYPDQINECRRRSVQLKEIAVQLNETLESGSPHSGIKSEIAKTEASPVRDPASESVKAAALRGALQSLELDFKRIQKKASDF